MKTPEFVCKKNGPYVVKGLRNLQNGANGEVYEAKEVTALCRCGGSKNKPYCDGTHAKIGFTDDKVDDRAPDKREDFAGDGVTVHDNRGICAHAGRCTEGLPSVFRLRKEPFVDATGAPADRIAEVIRTCPSGALSYSIGGVEHRDQDQPPGVVVVPGGPYAVRGGGQIEGEVLAEGASREHFTLCRCGGSKNKPLCDGSHWNVNFDENAPREG
jgi:CDGSH-type Zn-finger protein